MDLSDSNLEIDRASAAEQVASSLTALILQGHLASGTRLRASDFAESIGVSRNTFRESLRILQANGLVRHEPHRGAVVSAITPEDVHELFLIRRVLELPGLDALMEDAGGRKMGALRDAYKAMQAATDAESLNAADFSFHRAIVAGLDSDRLTVYYETVQSELRLALALLDRIDHDAVRLPEHGAILEAIEQHDASRAAEILASHLDASRDRLTELAETVAGASDDRDLSRIEADRIDAGVAED